LTLNWQGDRFVITMTEKNNALPILELDNLKVKVGGQEILHGIDCEVKQGETYVLFGPNGSGKTSLVMAIMGAPAWKVTSGKIWFKGKDITKVPMSERARRGIGMLFQRPPTVRGVTTRKMVEIASNRRANPEALASRLQVTSLLDRDINHGFSGGEIKRTEILQLLAQQPAFIMFDEPESGVDLENIVLIGQAMNELLGNETDPQQKRSGLIITHTGHILKYVPADRGYVLLDGKIICSGSPMKVLKQIEENGYERCRKCEK